MNGDGVSETVDVQRERMRDAAPGQARGPLGGWLAPLLVSALIFAAVAPTLTWVEFCNGMENTVTATVLQMKRGGPVWVPRLNETLRTQKPPLAVWIAASAVPRQTVAALDRPDALAPGGAYDHLARDIRLTALITGCLMLLAVYALGRVVGGSRIGVLSAAICGTSFLFLHHTRYATTDIQLALWVTAGNAFLALMLLERRWWLGSIGAGITLGLAMMSKGPVALVQSAVPAIVFVLWQRWATRPQRVVPVARGFPVAHGAADLDETIAPPPGDDDDNSAVRTPGGRATAPLLFGIALFLLIGLPWYAWVALKVPNMGAQWREELNATDQAASALEGWYLYIILIPLLAPWAVWFVVGLIGGGARLRPRVAGAEGPRGRRVVLVFLQVVVPVLIMSLFRNRKERYLLPMVAPAAVLSAWGMAQVCGWMRSAGSERAGRQKETTRVITSALHWALLAGLAIGLPLAGGFARAMRNVHGGAWFPAPLAIGAALGGAVLVALGIVLSRRRPIVLPVVTVIVMLPLQMLYVWGAGRSSEGLSDMKPIAAAIRAQPGRPSVYSYRPGTEARHAPQDLAIYLNALVTRARDVDAIPQGDGPQMLVVCQRRTHPLPPLPGWTALGRYRIPPNTWHLFERDARP